MENYKKCKINLPKNTEEIIIEEENYSDFESYGEKRYRIATIFKNRLGLV